MTEDVFATVFRLPQDEVNTHKLRIGKDISLEEVEALFGKEKAQNGFSVAEKLSTILRKEAKKLYCLCYQKTYPTLHVAKEFAISFILQHVKQDKVNWVH